MDVRMDVPTQHAGCLPYYPIAKAPLAGQSEQFPFILEGLFISPTAGEGEGEK